MDTTYIPMRRDFIYLSAVLDVGVGSHHDVLAPERIREHSIGDQMTALNVGSWIPYESPVIHCDETLVRVLKKPDRDPTSQSWMWVQASGPPDRKVMLFDYTSSRAQEVPLRLLESYRDYLLTDDCMRSINPTYRMAVV
ncbi:Transposase IS66 family protein [compost metagenome]|jgi:hypothetical protein